jgi:phage terminase large subunit
MYLTCNPGGVGHAWVKRLFVDREYRAGERAEEYCFIPALATDNPVLMRADPEYVKQLESLPPRMRDAWLYGHWDVFEGQFFPEFCEERHVFSPACGGADISRLAEELFVAMDYGFDRLAALLIARDADGQLSVLSERCASGLTLRQAAQVVVEMCGDWRIDYVVASPDLWNRRQDSGLSGVAVMQMVKGMPPMRKADDRRIEGWRLLREYLHGEQGKPRVRISSCCRELIECMKGLLCDGSRPEDASSRPHHLTHAPEALRYGVMSLSQLPKDEAEVRGDFRFVSSTGNVLKMWD